MKNKFILCSILITLIICTSCNTYHWQRKRYYNPESKKNWNNYHHKKAKDAQKGSSEDK